MSETVHIKRTGRVLEITLDRPPVNAINKQTNIQLYDAFRQLNDDLELIVGIITATGEKIFSAGWDLKEVAAGTEDSIPDSIDLGPGGLGGITEFFTLTKPLICAINGHAVGGGFEMAMACDLVIAAEHAEFFLPEMQRGFLPDAGAVQRLPHILPPHVVNDLIYTGRRMSAAEAARWGLVRDVVAAQDLMSTARRLAQQIAEGAPLALAAAKEVLSTFSQLTIEESFAETKKSWRKKGRLPLFERMLFSEDYSEGPRAFSEKRKPVWKGK